MPTMFPELMLKVAAFSDMAGRAVVRGVGGAGVGGAVGAATSSKENRRKGAIRGALVGGSLATAASPIGDRLSDSAVRTARKKLTGAQTSISTRYDRLSGMERKRSGERWGKATKALDAEKAGSPAWNAALGRREKLLESDTWRKLDSRRGKEQGRAQNRFARRRKLVERADAGTRWSLPAVGGALAGSRKKEAGK